MSIAVALIAGVATVNPFRLWPGLPGGSRGERVRLTAAGGALVVAAAALIAVFADPILGALDISDPNARIAAGVAIVVMGVRDTFASPAEVEPALDGWRAALVPVALPHLFAPGITLLAISASADRGLGVALLMLVVAVAAVVLVALWPAPSGALARACRAGQVITAGLAIAVGGSLMLDGVLDI